MGQETEHTLDALGKQVDFLACLEQRQLGCAEHTGGDVAQTGVLVVFPALDEPADDALQLGYEPNEDKDVAEVEAGVEGAEGVVDHRAVASDVGLCRGDVEGVETDQRADHVDERTEDAEHPHDAEDVEDEVGEGSAAGLGAGREGCDV